MGINRRREKQKRRTNANYRQENNRIQRKVGYCLDLYNPETFTEHMVKRKIDVRDPLMTRTADKVAVMDYVRKKCGEDILIPVYHVTNDPESIPFDDLPPEFMVKPNHMSGRTLPVRDGDYDRNAVISLCKRWLTERYHPHKQEWAYQDIEPKILVQKLLAADPLYDYTLYVVKGKVRFLNIYYHTPAGNLEYGYATPQWELIEDCIKRNKKFKRCDILPPKPEKLSEMIVIAETLAQPPIETCRVDLYYVDGKVYFGEITHYPGSGVLRMPLEYDIAWGKYFEE